MMSGKNSGLESGQYTRCCPINDKPVTVTPRQRHSILDGEAIWWHCPECRGWHLSLDAEKKSRPNTVPPLSFEPTTG